MEIPVLQVHGKLDKNENEKNLNQFRKEPKSVLVASDTMSRGIDVDDIDCVINYDKPERMKNFIHRVGRTARANNEGTSYLMIESDEVQEWREKFQKVKSKTVEEYFIGEDEIKAYKNYKQIIGKLKSETGK
jgi:superfamily II DNA/RNA helicase